MFGLHCFILQLFAKESHLRNGAQAGQQEWQLKQRRALDECKGGKQISASNMECILSKLIYVDSEGVCYIFLTLESFGWEFCKLTSKRLCLRICGVRGVARLPCPGCTVLLPHTAQTHALRLPPAAVSSCSMLCHLLGCPFQHSGSQASGVGGGGDTFLYEEGLSRAGW